MTTSGERETQTTPLRVRVVSGQDLSIEEHSAWSSIQKANENLSSPFFRPEFTLAVASVRDDVRVGIIETGDEAVGFFPFQSGRGQVGRPVGGPLSDYQGVIVRNGFRWEAKELIKGCGLSEWKFDHLLANQEPFKPYHRNTAISPVIDLGSAPNQLLQGGSEPRKRRNLEREVGPLRLEFHSTSTDILQELMRWKSLQYLESGKIDIFKIPWVVSVVEAVQAIQGEDFAGVLSVLYAGGEIVAAHMGMRSQTEWHYWLPAYNPKFSKYSPGMLLLLEMAAGGPAVGIQTLDLGKGKALYKDRLLNRMNLVAEGSVPVSLGRSMARVIRDGAISWMRSGPLAVPAKGIARFVRNSEKQLGLLHRLRSRWRFR